MKHFIRGQIFLEARLKLRLNSLKIEPMHIFKKSIIQACLCLLCPRQDRFLSLKNNLILSIIKHKFHDAPFFLLLLFQSLVQNIYCFSNFLLMNSLQLNPLFHSNLLIQFQYKSFSTKQWIFHRRKTLCYKFLKITL